MIRIFIFIQIMVLLIGSVYVNAEDKGLLISPDEVREKQIKGEDFLLVDIRAREEYEKKHIKGATWIPLMQLLYQKLSVEKEIIIYCFDYACSSSKNAVKKLIEFGYKKIKALDGGLNTWESRGFPLEGTSIVKEKQKIKVLNITAEQLKNLIDKKQKFLLIDVDKKNEFETGHIPTALNILLEELEEKIQNIDRSAIIIIYSRNSQRSKDASEIMIMNGFTNLKNYSGGLILWYKKGYEISIK